MPSRYLQEIPVELIDWKQSPGMANSRGGTQPRALNARREGGAGDRLGSTPRASGGYGGGSYDRATAAAKTKPKTEWSNRVTGTVRDNGDLELEQGDRISHVDFGEGRVMAVTGVGARRIAEVLFDTAGRKKLLIKVAPIEKLVLR